VTATAATPARNESEVPVNPVQRDASNLIHIERVSKVYSTGDIQVHALRAL
jgi:hypothetical protein